MEVKLQLENDKAADFSVLERAIVKFNLKVAISDDPIKDSVAEDVVADLTAAITTLYRVLKPLKDCDKITLEGIDYTKALVY